MIKLFLSNRAEKLGNMISSRLDHPVSGFFDPEMIVIQARGMERWLSMIIAQNNGICANYEFFFTKKIIAKIVHGEAGLDEELSPYNKDALRFAIFRLLENCGELGGEFDAIRRYCCNDSSGIKRFQLSGQIASVFEKYIYYRPEMLLSWESGIEEKNWQALLWNMITSGFDFPHPARLIKEFMAKVGKGNLIKELLPERISIFGISSMPYSYIDIFEAISDFCDISIYCLSPCSGYWSDIPTNIQRKNALRKNRNNDLMFFQETNDLLESLGESLSDFLKIMFGHEKIDEYELFDSDYSESHKSLLSFIQNTILFLENPSSGNGQKYSRPSCDDSITIHSCHSPMRETEVLYDNILCMLEKDLTLNFSDIIVMTSDPETYVPCVEAVFGSAGGSGVKLPFSFADKANDDEKKAQNCFLSILNLVNSRFTKSEVIEILGNRCVSARFGLDEGDIDLIRKWLSDVRVSAETDENHRKSIGLPAFRENSWAYAIDRFLLGIAMQDDDRDSFFGISPFSGITTSNYGTLSKFLGFWSALSSSVEKLKTKKTVDEWVLLVSELVDIFLDDKESGTAKRNIRKHIFRLRDISSIARLSEKIELPVIKGFFEEAFGDSASSYGFMTGGITFCAMLPMRSIPFRVICLLGMNNASFPRNDISYGFDLTLEKPQPGDPSIRKDDRQLFLDILISAREKLYISYTGQSSRDNSIIPPSVVISELIDYIENSSIKSDSEKNIDEILVKHPLHGFSPSSFTAKSDRLFSFNREYFEAASAIVSGERKQMKFWSNALGYGIDDKKGIDNKVISLTDLKKFWNNPCEFASRKRLGINLDIPGSSPEITGAYIPEALERYGVFVRNIELRNSVPDASERNKILKSQGFLPHGYLGTLTHSIYEKETFSLESVAGIDPSGISAIPIDIQSGGFTIYGSVRAALKNDPSEGQILVFMKYARINASVLLAAWMDFIVCMVAGCEAESFILAGFENSGIERSVSFKKSAKIDKDKAEEYLEKLVAGYSSGLLEPLPFLPELSMNFANGVLNGKDEKVLYSDIEKSIKGFSPIIRSGFYEELCFGNNLTDFFCNSDNFRKTSLDIFIPLLKSI